MKYPGYFINTWAGADKNGTKITLYTFDGTTDQRYVIESVGNGEYYIRAYSSKKGKGRIWDIYWGNHSSKKVIAGMPLDIWASSASEEKFQKFLLKQNDDGSVSFVVASNPKLAVAVNKGKNGSQLLVKEYSSNDKAVRFYICDIGGERIALASDAKQNTTLGAPLSSGISATVSSFSIKSTENISVNVNLTAVALSDTVTVKIGKAEKTVKPIIHPDRIAQSAKITFSGTELVKENGISNNAYEIEIVCRNYKGEVNKNIGSLTVSSDFCKPLKAISGGKTNIVTQGFGSNAYYGNKDHLGVDYSGVASFVTAITDGEVVDIFTGYGYGYGNTVILRHVIEGTEIFTLYGHTENNSLKVKVGDFVAAGQVLGTMGSTGESSGAHVHISVFGMKNYKPKTIPAGYYNTTFSNTASVLYNGILYHSAEKFIATHGTVIQ